MPWIDRRTARFRIFDAGPQPGRRTRSLLRCNGIIIGTIAVALCICSRCDAQQAPAATPNSLASAQPVAPRQQFLVVLDPAHGGTDTGAILTPAHPEKNYTLTMAVRLHVLLNTHGIPSTLTRDSDTAMDSDARAQIANRSHAAACILLHATASGVGVHLFTSSLPSATVTDPGRAFLPWRTAQSSFATPSLRLESEINTAFGERHIPALLERTSMPTLDSMACPAVAVEVAPLNSTTPVTDQAYQEEVAETLAKAIVAWRSDWRLQR